MCQIEAKAREALDRTRADFERAKANCDSTEAAVNAAYALQKAAEDEYNRFSEQLTVKVQEAAHAFADGDDREPIFESNREFEEVNADLERCISNVTIFERDLHKTELVKSAASQALDRACHDVIKAHVASETARAWPAREDRSIARVIR